MSVTYDLLIIYSDKTRKIVHGVTEYGTDEDNVLLYFKKNGYRSFVPINQVQFFGRLFDYDDGEELYNE